MSKLPPKTYVIRKYQPNQALGQYVEGTCLAGENVIFEAEGYSRVFNGWSDTGETNAAELMGYSVALTANSSTVTFSGGSPATDFAPYQHAQLGSHLYLIQKIDGLTATIDPPAAITAAAAEVRRVPNLHAITRQKPERLSLYAGNAIRYREEAIFAAGRGPLRISGVAISAALTATDAVQVAYPIAGGSTYDARPAGFTAPSAPTVTVIGGGSKDMPLQRYSFVVTKKRKGFPGYGLGSAPVEATLASSGDRFEITFAAFDTAEGQDAAQLWVSSTEDTVAGKAWFLLAEYDTVGPHQVEWYDGELGTLYSIDNFPPPPSLFVESVNDHLLFVSCLGKPNSSGEPTAPGPGVAVAKPNNPEAASPAAYAFVTPASDIVGVKVGKVGVRAQDSSVYFLTQDGISFGRFVDSDVSPLVVDPAGSNGVSHNYSAAFAGDYLYAFSGGMLVRTTDGRNIETEFSSDVKPDLAELKKARTFVGFDPKNGWVVVLHSNDRQHTSGGWQTRAWSFNVVTGAWNTPVYLGDGVTDFTVCGAATVGQRLYVVTTNGKAWEWDAGNLTMSGYAAVNWNDFGDASMQKWVRGVKVAGAIVGTIQLHTNYSSFLSVATNDALLLHDLVSGTNAAASKAVNVGSVPFTRTYPVWRPNTPFRHLAWRMSFTQAVGGNRLLDSVGIVAHGRGGMSY